MPVYVYACTRKSRRKRVQTDRGEREAKDEKEEKGSPEA